MTRTDLRRFVPRRIADPRGFTLAEILVAAALVSIAFLALAGLVPLAFYGVQEGNQLSTATFLADQKLEQAKNLPWTSAPANDCLGVSASGTAAPTVPATASCTDGATTVAGNGSIPWLADEAAVAGFPVYSRAVRVTDCGAGGGCTGVTDSRLRLVTVAVTYTPGTSSNQATTPKSVQVQMVISQR
jgi:prepilin-type N-terminal cleavage/methylation domain-containing protein